MLREGDHISGLVPLMCHLLNGDGGITEEGGGDPRLDTPAIPVKVCCQSILSIPF